MRRPVLWMIAAPAALFGVAAAVTDVPLPSIEPVWSIGVYRGSSPVEIAAPHGPRNPILTAADVSDAAAAFVADPFLARDGATWHLVFEVFDRDARRGAIGWATSVDLAAWRYERIVLREPFH